MGLLTFPSDKVQVIADASVWINLAASGQASEILRAIPNRILISDVALSELDRGRITGRTTIVEVERLLGLGQISQVSCPEEADETYFALIGGSARDTLDDGEACTIAYAHHAGITALIDERKATDVAARRFPQLHLLSTTDLFLSTCVLGRLGAAAVADALFNALTGAYMRVPTRCLPDVINVLGNDRCKQCPSLPASARTP